MISDSGDAHELLARVRLRIARGRNTPTTTVQAPSRPGTLPLSIVDDGSRGATEEDACISVFHFRGDSNG